MLLFGAAALESGGVASAGGFVGVTFFFSGCWGGGIGDRGIYGGNECMGWVSGARLEIGEKNERDVREE